MNYFTLSVDGEYETSTKPTDYKEIQKIVEGDFEVREFDVKVGKKYKKTTIYMNEDGRRNFVFNMRASLLIKNEKNNKYFVGSNDEGDMVLGVPKIFGNILIKTRLVKWM